VLYVREFGRELALSAEQADAATRGDGGDDMSKQRTQDR